MLSIEEIKLLIEKLEKAKATDFQELIDTNLKVLKDLELAVDANNNEAIERLDKPERWFALDLEKKRLKPIVDQMLYRMLQTKIFQFQRTSSSSTSGGLYNSLEIGPGTGMFSKEFRSWRLNYFLDILPEVENKIRRRFPPLHQKYLKFYLRTRETRLFKTYHKTVVTLYSVGTHLCFSRSRHVQQYLHDIKRVLDTRRLLFHTVCRLSLRF